jgi:hypothetical protein
MKQTTTTVQPKTTSSLSPKSITVELSKLWILTKMATFPTGARSVKDARSGRCYTPGRDSDKETSDEQVQMYPNIRKITGEYLLREITLK